MPVSKISVALSGQPNCGKSTMFNAITGSTARVGNYPGITVERMEGKYRKGDWEVCITDLPGTYSLTSYSLEEVVARDVIIDERPDVVICMLDTMALERSLYLTVQLMELGVPIVIGLNMMDEVRKKGIHDKLLTFVKKFTEHSEKTLNTYPEAIVADSRYGFISSVVKQEVIKRNANLRYDISDKIDRFLTQRLLGPVIMLGVLYLFFYFTFNLGAFPQGWMEDGFAFAGSLAEAYIPNELIQSLVVNGIINGVGAVLSFAPLIMIMFAMLVFLEDLGYMARVAYMLDRVFRAFGLHGASVMPFIISGGIPGGCAVPGVMTTRTLRSPKERLATIFTAPFMICGAKTTVYLVLAGAFFPEHATRVMFFLTITSWLFVLCTARLLRWTVIKGLPTPFVMELPPYRMPTAYGVAIHTWDRVWQFVKKAGTVIFVISIVMWVLMTFPRLPWKNHQEFDAQKKTAAEKFNRLLEFRRITPDKKDELLKRRLSVIDSECSKAALKYSIAGRIGVSMEKITEYAGFPWQMNIALLGGFAAKEVIISTLSTAYAIGDTETGAEKRVPGDSRPGSGNDDGGNTFKTRLAQDPAWTMSAVISVFVFMLLYAPCMVTFVAIVKESSWKGSGRFSPQSQA